MFTKQAAFLAALIMAALPCFAARGVESSAFGATPRGEQVALYTLTNKNGLEARIINYGGIVASLKVPDKNGRLGDVVLGFDDLDGYLGENPYFGALIGRYGNRIAKGRFTLEGRTYTLAVNNGPNALHGGIRGFNRVVWTAKSFVHANGVGVVLTYVSRHGEEGYPGTLAATVTYTLTDGDALRIDYEATTDEPTVLNLTNHSYFNLKDGGASPIVDHELLIAADHYTPVDETLIPTGEMAPVEATPFDFRESQTIGARIAESSDDQIRFGGGYDHNFALRKSRPGLELAVRVVDPTSGRVMEVYTTEPGVQFYTGNFLDGSLVGKGGATYGRRHGFCLETQHYPDSPNQPAFPSTVLKPGERYRSRTEYRFSVR